MHITQNLPKWVCIIQYEDLCIFWLGRSRFWRWTMHYEVLCIMSLCIMSKCTVLASRTSLRCSVGAVREYSIIPINQKRSFVRWRYYWWQWSNCAKDTIHIRDVLNAGELTPERRWWSSHPGQRLCKDISVLCIAVRDNRRCTGQRPSITIDGIGHSRSMSWDSMSIRCQLVGFLRPAGSVPSIEASMQCHL